VRPSARIDALQGLLASRRPARKRPWLVKMHKNHLSASQGHQPKAKPAPALHLAHHDTQPTYRCNSGRGSAQRKQITCWT
jgi:hypothetical protein